MRKVLCTMAGAGLAFGLSAAAVAGPVKKLDFQKAELEAVKTPIEYARIERTADGKFTMGQWRAYGTQTRGADCSDGLAWDAYIPDTAAGTWAPYNHLTICPNGWGTTGWAETSAWYFGPTANNPHYANDMTYAAGSSSCSKELGIAWSWNPIPPFPDPNLGEPMLVAIFTSTTPYAADCVAPVAGGTGWIFNFGSSLPGAGYFYSHINQGCTDPNVFWDLGTNGGGGYEVIWSQGVAPDPNDPNFIVITIASRAQPMLWANSHSNATGSPNPSWANAGSSDVAHFDDDFPLDPNTGNPTVDGVFDPNNECYAYGPFALPNGQCPEPNLSSMMVFGYSNEGCGGAGNPCGDACANPGCNSGGVDADFNNDCIVGLPDLSILLANFGGAGDCSTGDTNTSNTVDLTDLSNLLSRFGTNCN